MTKNVVKIVLDILLVVTLTLLYSTAALGLTFHEIAGLIIGGVFIVHIALNWKSISQHLPKLFSKGLPGRIRADYIVIFLLLISFVMIIVSGILISEVLFPGIGGHSQAWRIVHYFFSGLTIVLIGVHIALNWDFIKGMFGKLLQLPKTVTRVVGAVMLVILLAIGAYSLVTSNFTSLIGAPASSSGRGGPSGIEGGRNFPGRPDSSASPAAETPSSETPATPNPSESPAAVEPGSGSGNDGRPEWPGDGQAPQFPGNGDGQGPGSSDGSGPGNFPGRGDGTDAGNGQFPTGDGQFPGRDSGHRSGGGLSSFTGAVVDIMTYLSLFAVFGAITRLIMWLAGRRKKSAVPAAAVVPGAVVPETVVPGAQPTPAPTAEPAPAQPTPAPTVEPEQTQPPTEPEAPAAENPDDPGEGQPSA
ncbi:MAG: DUF4405 domain-containing protein [Propionibacteriaceae bacterium]|jgi:hypothetical protein|nr:DUF4405 domain-containing protein [Propionibacteriaceae bacterium]